MQTKQLDQIVKRFLEPLNDETKKLLRPITPKPNDVMHLRLDNNGENFIADFYAILNDKETYPSYNANTLIGRIPQRRRIRTNDWHKTTMGFAGTDFTALIIHSCWPIEQIEFEEDAKILYTFLLTRFLRQTESARVYAEYKLKGIQPKPPEGFYDHPQYPLMSFQSTAIAAQADTEGSNLWMEQGTGKTPIVISRINYEAHKVYKKENRMYRALIVVPKAVRLSWQNKIMQFGIFPGKVTVLKGDQLTRVKLLVEAFKHDPEAEYTIVICSYEAVLRSWDGLKLAEWDLCCLDEAHKIKSPSTKRWAAMQLLRERCKARTGLTGTPFANSLFDVFTQLEWLGKGLSGFTSFKAFRAYYGKFLPRDGRGFDKLAGYKNLPILQERIARLCFQITRKEALPELPEKTYDILEVTMTSKQRDYYIQLRDQLMIEIEEDLNRDTKMSKQMTATHVLTKLLRLSQITAGYIKWDAQYDEETGELLNEDELYQEITPNPKVEALLDFIKETPDHAKLIVWCNWVPAIKIISKALEEAGILHVLYYGGVKDKDRDENVRLYNEDPRYKVFLGNPAAGGVGLDLWGYNPLWDGTEKDHGCNTEYQIFFCQDWSMINRSQAEDRSTRRGTRKSVQIIDLIVPGSIDQEIAQRVMQKQMDALELQDVRNVMKRILETLPSTNDE